MNKITTRAKEIRKTCKLEYADAGDEALWQMASDMKWLGWSEDEVELLLAELGF